jgi:hypothetical protein
MEQISDRVWHEQGVFFPCESQPPDCPPTIPCQTSQFACTRCVQLYCIMFAPTGTLTCSWTLWRIQVLRALPCASHLDVPCTHVGTLTPCTKTQRRGRPPQAPRVAAQEHQRHQTGQCAPGNGGGQQGRHTLYPQTRQGGEVWVPLYFPVLVLQCWRASLCAGSE